MGLSMIQVKEGDIFFGLPKSEIKFGNNYLYFKVLSATDNHVVVHRLATKLYKKGEEIRQLALPDVLATDWVDDGVQVYQKMVRFTCLLKDSEGPEIHIAALNVQCRLVSGEQDLDTPYSI